MLKNANNLQMYKLFLYKHPFPTPTGHLSLRCALVFVSLAGKCSLAENHPLRWLVFCVIWRLGVRPLSIGYIKIPTWPESGR